MQNKTKLLDLLKELHISLVKKKSRHIFLTCILQNGVVFRIVVDSTIIVVVVDFSFLGLDGIFATG